MNYHPMDSAEQELFNGLRILPISNKLQDRIYAALFLLPHNRFIPLDTAARRLKKEFALLDLILAPTSGPANEESVRLLLDELEQLPGREEWMTAAAPALQDQADIVRIAGYIKLINDLWSALLRELHAAPKNVPAELSS